MTRERHTAPGHNEGISFIMVDLPNSTNAPDCANCERPIRAICDLLAEKIHQERRALAWPASDRERRVADLVVSERLQAQLWRMCERPECAGSREARMRTLH
jgi:hypothetical protein